MEMNPSTFIFEHVCFFGKNKVSDSEDFDSCSDKVNAQSVEFK